MPEGYPKVSGLLAGLDRGKQPQASNCMISMVYYSLITGFGKAVILIKYPNFPSRYYGGLFG